jgi:AcrR family transcriptional regulator
MARPYTLKRRAEQQADTRLRIVEAAVALHGELGPAHTPLTRVAEQAGVTRNTLYSHFPDERSLLLACSALSLERDPLPDAAPWRAVKDREERLRTGLSAIYAWYERNADLAGCVLRDAQSHAPTREVTQLRFGPSFLQYATVLGAGLAKAPRAMLGLALGYPAWRSLASDGGLKSAEAARVMAKAIVGAAG